MPPIELGPARPVSAVDARLARPAGAAKEAPARVEAGRAPVVRSDALDPGQPPVDAERVEIVRKAVENGTYPVIPAKVADAIIAAGFLLRNPK
jgi:negative regulator of flagellin synthesis FlgM